MIKRLKNIWDIGEYHIVPTKTDKGVEGQPQLISDAKPKGQAKIVEADVDLFKEIDNAETN